MNTPINNSSATNHDPIARFILIALGVLVAYLVIANPSMPPAQAAGNRQIIVIATPLVAGDGQMFAGGQVGPEQPANSAAQPTQTLADALAALQQSSPDLAAQASSESGAQLGEHNQTTPPSGERLYFPDGSFEVAGSKVRYYTDSTGQVVEARLPGSEPAAQPAAQPAQPIEQSPMYVAPEVYQSLPTAAPPPSNPEPMRWAPKHRTR